MTAIEAIMKRRSIRKFKDIAIDKEIAMQLIDAADAAPSAMNRRPVRFILMDKSDMERLASKIDQKVPFEQGQWAIAICADTRDYKGKLGWLEDASAAMENILIAATSLGLGSLWYGVYNREPKQSQVRAALSIPEGVEVAGIAIIGQADEEKPAYEKANPARVMTSKWSE